MTKTQVKERSNGGAAKGPLGLGLQLAGAATWELRGVLQPSEDKRVLTFKYDKTPEGKLYLPQAVAFGIQPIDSIELMDIEALYLVDSEGAARILNGTPLFYSIPQGSGLVLTFSMRSGKVLQNMVEQSAAFTLPFLYDADKHKVRSWLSGQAIDGQQ